MKQIQFITVVVAQLVRASVCGTEGRRFEPGLPPRVATYSMYKLIALEGANSTYKDSLAFIYFSSRKYGSCFLMANEVLERDPKNEPILEIKAIALESLGAIDKSLETYAELFELSNNNYHGYTLAKLQLAMKQYT